MAGYAADYTTSAEEALCVASAVWPDVMIVDLLMPKKDGYTVAAEVRVQADKPRPVMIAHSGDAAIAVANKALETGFDHFLPKPAELADLLALLVARQPYDSGRRGAGAVTCREQPARGQDQKASLEELP